MLSKHHARLERQIAVAHKVMWNTKLAALSANDLDLGEECQLILEWLEIVQTDLLRHRKTRSMRVASQTRLSRPA